MQTSRPTKQTQRALEIVRESPLLQFNAEPSPLVKLMERSGKPTRLQQKIAGETVTRAGSIQATEMLHTWGSQHIARAHITSQQSAYHTFSQLNAVKAMARDPETARDMDAFTTAQKELYIRHESTLLNASVGNIIRLATTPLPDEEEQKPKGFLDWLLGGGD